MGIHCEISLIKSMDGVYKPGAIVSGNIKYAVDKATEFTRIIVSLKGYALLRIYERIVINTGSSTTVHTITHVNKEVIVDNDSVIKSENFTMNIGSEDIPFHFQLPAIIPPTLKCSKYRGNESIHCSIIYYVRIKFDKPSFLDRAKRFKKEIPVVSGIIPVLPRVPTICGEKKTLSNIFSRKYNVVHLKAVIQDSVIETGGKVRFNCEVKNLTNIKVKALKIRLKEVYTFMKNKNSGTKVVKYVKQPHFKSSSIKIGDEETFDFVIDVPTDRVSLEHSQIIFRKYFVEILAMLPFPHRNLPLAIPLQIGDILESEVHIVPMLMERDVNAEAGGASSSKEPPTYWEAMGEEQVDLFANIDEQKKKEK